MEFFISFVAAIVGENGRSCFATVNSTVMSTLQFNLNDWENEMNDLLDLKNYIEHQLDAVELDGRSPATEVKKWLREVEKFMIKATSVLQGLTATNQRHFGRLVRFRLRWKAARMLKKMEGLLQAGSFPAGLVSKNYLTRVVEHIPGPSIEDQMTASRTLAELLEKLDDQRIHRIGIWGMGGVGKTTLVKNLNNKLNSSSLRHPFSCVIWATVSKDLDEKRIQIQIAERLNLEVKMEESIQRTARRLYQRLKKEERFLLILDDVWGKIDLDCLGVPQPEIHNGSKILLTSRFSEVCREMLTDIDVKLNVLSKEEAWELFSEKAGEVVSLERIKPFAEVVARECCGLPLALITVGTAMRGKTKVELWKHALKELQRSAPSTRGMKDKVYKPLKWSYDSLEGNKTKACFLYCALFPEDYSIEVSELVWYWLAEGLIDEQQTFEDSVDNGISLIETLKDCCLLEDGNSEGTVKMHDVVRDVAIWIASSLEDECISLIRSGIGLSEICEVELSNSLKRVSFMNNRINELPESEIQCSNASTLLLQGNFPLKDVPERFVQGFRALRVFNISGTQIQSLPPLLQLGDLRALLLGNCYYLEELPSLEQLSRLLVLDLRATGIRQLPKEMENLINLKKVNLSYTYDLKDIQGGIMSKWTCLEVLDMKFSAYHWGMKEEVEEGQTSLEELRCLKQLFSLSIGLKSIPCLCSEDLLWISRLRVFELLIGPTANSLPTRLDERWVTFGGLDLSGQWIEWSFVNATSLVLDGCKGLDKMLEDLAISSVFSFANTNSFGSFVGLKSLTLTSSDSAIQPAGGCGAPSDLLPNLEELHLEDLQGIQSISELVGHLGLTFSKLKLIEVSNCYKMKCLLTCGNFIVSLEDLETIKVRSCHNLDVLFNNVSAQNSGARVVVPNIRRLELLILNKLSNFCTPIESWPSLEHVAVLSCQLLSKLPLTIQNADTIKEIRGESYWWSKLEWDNDDTKSALQPYFRPY